MKSEPGGVGEDSVHRGVCPVIQRCRLNVGVPTQHPGVRLLGAEHRSGIAQHPVRRVGVVEDLGVERVVPDTHVDHGHSTTIATTVWGLGV